jgi:hypothetical protein
MTEEKHGENDFTTVRLERDFVEELQNRMTYGDTYNDFLQNRLDIETNED